MFFYRYFETLLIVCLCVCVYLRTVVCICYWFMLAKTHNQHEKMTHHACFFSYLLALFVFIFIYLSLQAHFFTMFVISFRISIWVVEFYLCVSCCFLVVAFSLILTAFCPGISYQRFITIAYLNHSYLLVKSLVNFEFSLLLVLRMWICLFVWVCFLWMFLSLHTEWWKRVQIYFVTDNFFVRLISSKRVSLTISLALRQQ